jgi:3-isopropylmalate dehydrogenase
VLDAALVGSGVSVSVEHKLIGGAAIDAVGSALPDDTLDACMASDGVLLGAVGGPKWADQSTLETSPEQGLLKIRKSMDLFANLRPLIFFPELLEATPLRPDLVRGVDCIFVRELVGGAYFGEREEGDERAWDTIDYSRPEVERVVRVAAELAAQRSGRITSVDKANVLASSRLWRKVATQVVESDFPTLELDHRYVDSAAMDLVLRPRDFDVVVTENMFGDILTDLASVLPGSLGLLPSASLSYPGKPGIFEGIHGSAPDIAGQGIANPVACILSAALLLRHGLDLPERADAIDAAVAQAFTDGYRTADVAGYGDEARPVSSTSEMGTAVLERLQL